MKSHLTHPPCILEEVSLYQSHWVHLAQRKYRNANGIEGTWDCVHRPQHTQATIIIPRLIPSQRYIVIKQFRPAASAEVLEFPAGLIDPGETPEQTAIRELQEETGYQGTVQHLSPPIYSSPGLLSEACYLAFMDVDESLECNQHPKPNPESNECIEVFIKSLDELPSFIAEEAQQGVVVDAKFFCLLQSIQPIAMKQ